MKVKDNDKVKKTTFIRLHYTQDLNFIRNLKSKHIKSSNRAGDVALFKHSDLATL